MTAHAYGCAVTSPVIPSYPVPHGNWHYVTKNKTVGSCKFNHSEDDRKIEHVYSNILTVFTFYYFKMNFVSNKEFKQWNIFPFQALS